MHLVGEDVEMAKRRTTFALFFGNRGFFPAHLMAQARRELPAVLANVLEPLAQANVPLAMLTVGLFIDLRTRHMGAIALALFVKMGLGWALGQGAAALLGLEGLNRLVVTTAPAMPVGLIVLAYAAREGLDTEFAANLISLSILIGLIVTPLLLAAR